METPPLALSLYIIIFFFSFLLFFTSLFAKKCRKLPLPPGPPGYPIIGHMHMMGQLTHRGLAELGKHYGGLFHLRLGAVHNVVVSTPDMAREVLQVYDHIFSNRPTTVAVQYLTYNKADVAFADYGPFWLRMRKIFVMRLFSRKRVGSWTSIGDEVRSLIRAVHSGAGQQMNLGKLTFNMTRNITCRAAFGSKFDEGQEEFMTILLEFSKLMGAFNIVDFLPACLRWVDPQGLNKRLERVRGALDRFINNIIDEHMAAAAQKRKKLVEETDIVDDLITFLDDRQGARPGSGELQGSNRLTRDNVKAIIMDIMFGGTETIAFAIEWVMAELMKHPREMEKLQAELAAVVGMHRNVHESDLDKVPYLKCVVKETLRLHPPIPLLLHKTAKESAVGGHFIPAGTRVSINVWALGRDPSSWEDPNTFNPGRFAQEGAADLKGNCFMFIPFGSGRRSCPGMQLSLHALELAVAQLAHSFTWALPDGMLPSDVDMSDAFGLTAPRAHRLVAVPTPRLKCPF